MSIIGYAYEADTHCVNCTEKRFKTKDLDPETPIEDNEGNEIHPMFPWEEHGYYTCDGDDECDQMCGL